MGSSRRKIDEFNEQYMSKLIDQAYNAMGLSVMDVTDKDLQVAGVDKILVDKAGRVIFSDEKVDMSRQLTENTKWDDGGCRTFAVELSTRNKRGFRECGWFHPNARKHKLNDYYTFVWCMFQKDEERKFTKISRIEVCIISYEKLAEITGLTNSKECDKLVSSILEAGKYRHARNDTTHLVYSKNFWERPINAVIKKYALREKALYSCVAKFDGELGLEQLTSIENLSPIPFGEVPIDSQAKAQEQLPTGELNKIKVDVWAPCDSSKSSAATAKKKRACKKDEDLSLY